MRPLLKYIDKFTITGRGIVFVVSQSENNVKLSELKGKEVEIDGKIGIVTGLEMFQLPSDINQDPIGILVKFTS